MRGGGERKREAKATYKMREAPGGMCPGNPLCLMSVEVWEARYRPGLAWDGPGC